jgi:hypothetical protein
LPSRRTFLTRLGTAAAAMAARRTLLAQVAPTSRDGVAATRAREAAADVVIVGGGFGGCAAALAAARRGMRVVMTEETDWVGGQLTAQAVPLDENAWIEGVGVSRSYAALRQGIRDYYRRHYPLTSAAAANPQLNPGNGTVSRLCHEPRVGLAVLDAMLAPFVASGRVRVLLRHRPLRANVERDRVQAVTVMSVESGRDLVLRAPIVVDATELGDLLPITGTEYVTGAESHAETGEAHAPAVASPSNQQAFTCCFAMDYVAGEDFVGDRPRGYAFWQSHVPSLTPPWPGRLLDLAYSSPRTLKPFVMGFDPAASTGLFHYRRIIDRGNFTPGAFAGDITLVNWPQNDYMLGNLIDVPAPEAARHVEAAKQLSLSLLYWLQTECPRPDGGTGWKGLRLRPDIAGTEDGLAKYPYVRESRRIRAEFTVTEQHVSTADRMRVGKVARPEDARAEPFRDSIGIGSYPIDLHPSSGGDNYIDFEARPFQIPLGALIPRRVENLLPACKNIGTTHITNGCYRLHPVEWSIGEAAGSLAAFALARGVSPRAVRNTPDLLSDFQKSLRDDGVVLEWPGI